MFLRALTTDEVAQIKTAKHEANQVLTDRRKELSFRIKKLRKFGHQDVRQLEKERESIRIVTGSPVVIAVDGDSMFIDYELLKKFDRMLDPRNWQRSFQMKRILGKPILTIQYQKNKQSGVLELYELPAYQTELLKNLPVVEVSEWF